MNMIMVLIFLAGVLNFAMNRAMVDSKDPLMQQAVQGFQRRLGPYSTYVLEYLFLVAALSWATRSGTALFFYGLYTAMNAMSLYLLKQRR
jgi:hypothetical protein